MPTRPSWIRAGEASALARLRRRGHPLGQLPGGRLRPAATAFVNLIRLGNDLDPQRFDGDLLLFTSDAVGSGRPELPAQVWRPFVGGRIEEVPLPAGHADLLSDPASVAMIAAELDARRAG